MSGFSSLNLPLLLTQQLQRLSLTQPTPIQAQAIPLALAGEDILASSQTGSGKTIAFLAPLMTHLMDNAQNKGLILLPTREIALQVMEVFKKLLGSSQEICCALLIGGDSMPKQLAQLKRNPNLIIGTPGRICDHLERRSLSLQQTNFLVLDEVDRMLDMGFSKPLNRICQMLCVKRQTLMFSATLPAAIEQLAQRYLTNPKRIAITATLQTAPQITQDMLHAANSEKMPLLLEQLQEQEGSVLVFVKTKRRARDLALKLTDHRHRVAAIHGDLPQNKRTRIMNNFRRENTRIMVATDVAARGLDVPHINLVINYDLPVCPEDYIHRIGRTGRAGAMGRALSFIAPEEGRQWKAIMRLVDPNASPDDAPKHKTKKSPSPQKKRSWSGEKKNSSPAKKKTRSFEKKSGHRAEGDSNRKTSLASHKKPWRKSEGKSSDTGNVSFSQKKPWHKKGPNRKGRVARPNQTGRPNTFSRARAA